MAREVVTLVIKLCQEKHVVSNKIGGSLEFFQAEAEKQHKRVLEDNEKIYQLKTENNLANLTQHQDILVSRIGSVQNHLLDVRAQIKTLESEQDQRANHDLASAIDRHKRSDRFAQYGD